MDYVKLALLGFQIVKWLLDKAHDAQQFNAGAQAEVLKASKAVMAMTAQGKKIMEKIDALDDDGLDQLERELTADDAKSR